MVSLIFSLSSRNTLLFGTFKRNAEFRKHSRKILYRFCGEMCRTVGFRKEENLVARDPTLSRQRMTRTTSGSSHRISIEAIHWTKAGHDVLRLGEAFEITEKRGFELLGGGSTGSEIISKTGLVMIRS